jgi:hypothetical protein
MTSTRYVLTPLTDAKLDEYIQAAIAAITAIAGRPLESLDGIPEHLRYLFREEVASAPGFKMTLPGEAVKADDLGWVHSFKPQPTAREALDLLAVHAAADMPSDAADECRRVVLGYITLLEVMAKDRDQLAFEAERLRADVHSWHQAANKATAERDALRMKHGEF